MRKHKRRQSLRRWSPSRQRDVTARWHAPPGSFVQPLAAARL